MRKPYALRLTLDARRRNAALCSFLAAAAVVFAGCGTACRCCRPATVAPKDAPELVEIDGREYTLAASMWRDFMPMAPPDGESLVAILKVSPSDMIPLPVDLAIDHVWVLNGQKQWSVPVGQPSGTGQAPATHLEQSIRGGPKWGPGIKVDVVARLKEGKQTWLVRAAGVEIKRTD
jgi:hypothetical protein